MTTWLESVCACVCVALCNQGGGGHDATRTARGLATHRTLSQKTIQRILGSRAPTFPPYRQTNEAAQPAQPAQGTRYHYYQYFGLYLIGERFNVRYTRVVRRVGPQQIAQQPLHLWLRSGKRTTNTA